jgi:hypothetical protein
MDRLRSDSSSDSSTAEQGSLKRSRLNAAVGADAGDVRQTFLDNVDRIERGAKARDERKAFMLEKQDVKVTSAIKDVDSLLAELDKLQRMYGSEVHKLARLQEKAMDDAIEAADAGIKMHGAIAAAAAEEHVNALNLLHDLVIADADWRLPESRMFVPAVRSLRPAAALVHRMMHVTNVIRDPTLKVIIHDIETRGPCIEVTLFLETTGGHAWEPLNIEDIRITLSVAANVAAIVQRPTRVDDACNALRSVFRFRCEVKDDIDDIERRHCDVLPLLAILLYCHGVFVSTCVPWPTFDADWPMLDPVDHGRRLECPLTPGYFALRLASVVFNACGNYAVAIFECKDSKFRAVVYRVPSFEEVPGRGWVCQNTGDWRFAGVYFIDNMEYCIVGKGQRDGLEHLHFQYKSLTDDSFHSGHFMTGLLAPAFHTSGLTHVPIAFLLHKLGGYVADVKASETEICSFTLTKDDIFETEATIHGDVIDMCISPDGNKLSVHCYTHIRHFDIDRSTRKLKPAGVTNFITNTLIDSSAHILADNHNHLIVYNKSLFNLDVIGISGHLHRLNSVFSTTFNRFKICTCAIVGMRLYIFYEDAQFIAWKNQADH